MPESRLVDLTTDDHHELIATGTERIGIDTEFLDHLFRSRERSWRELYHYFVLDLPSMAWSLDIRSLTGSSIADTLGVEDEPHVAHLHTGITGARLNARIYRALLTQSTRSSSHDE